MSVDGTPISRADLARIEAEEKLHAQQQCRVARVIAGASTDTDDARTLLSMLGLDDAVVAAARYESTVAAPVKRARKRRAA